MLFLPKTDPLHEHVSTRSLNLPDLLKKLAKGEFTGYVQFTSSQTTAFSVFSLGKLIGVVSTEKAKTRTGLDALASMFEKILVVGGEISVYRMTTDLSMCAHALALGRLLHNGEAVRQVDMKGVLARLKQQGLNGAVLFAAGERHAMIFYKGGQAIGFYHDGTSALDASPDESRKVAALPGAQLYVYATKPIEELLSYDLLQLVNLDKLWSAAEARQSAIRRAAVPEEDIDKDTAPHNDILRELEEDLRELAMAYLSKEGRAMLEHQLRLAGGCAILADSTLLADFLGKVRQEAYRIDGQARIDEMIDLMKSEIAGRLAT